MIEITVRCGCGRTMSVDATAGGRYRCGCGARVALSGLPKLDARHCPMPRGNRICNGPKDPDHYLCEPCSVRVAGLALTIPEQADQIAETRASVDFHQKYDVQFSLLRERREEKRQAFDRRMNALKVCLVYYCLLRPGIVKIGTTTQLGQRMEAFRVPAENVLAAEPGYFKLENLRHQQFAAQRIHPKREDFRLDDALQSHVDATRLLHGDPFGLDAQICAKQQELAQDPNSELLFAKVAELST